ncbi:MAG: glycosyltransferase family 2 protein [Streptococcus salivarius]
MLIFANLTCFSESTLPNEQDFFSKEINVCNNSHGAAVYAGSNTLIFRARRLRDVGGFRTDTITERISRLGVRINAAGYVNYSTKSPMASGLTPTDLKSVLKQRARWGRGVIRSSYNMNIFFNPKLTKGQRIVYINGYLYWWSFFRRLLYILAPILYAVFHVRVGGVRYLATVPILVAKLRIDTLVNARSLKTIPNTGLGRNCGNDFCSAYLFYSLYDVWSPLAISDKNLKVTRKGEMIRRGRCYLYALPYLVLWGLAVYGLVTFNYGKFGFRAFLWKYYQFFWLIYPCIINLTFAIFCALGRPIYPAQVRRFYCR